MLFSKLLLAFVTLAAAQQEKLSTIIFFSESSYEGKEFEIPTTDSTFYYACVNVYSLLGESTAKSAVITKGSNCLIYENEECQGRAAYKLNKNTSMFLVPGRSGPVLGKSVKCIFPAGESSLDKEQGYAPEL